MNNIIALEIKSDKTHHAIHIPKQVKQVKQVLKLWNEIFKVASQGGIMNLLNFSYHNHIIVGNECEHGLGVLTQP